MTLLEPNLAARRGAFPVGDLAMSLAVIAVLVLVPFVVESRYLLGQVILTLFLATIASQWNLLFGYAGVFSLAQMAVFGFGGYATAMLCVYFGLGVWSAMPLGALAAVVLSVVIGVACLRLSGVYVALLTLAIAQALYVLIVTDTDCFRMVGSACRQFTGGAVGFARFGDFGTRAWLRAKWLVRGRDVHCWTPPAQIRTGGIPASGSYLGCLTAKRTLGQG